MDQTTEAAKIHDLITVVPLSIQDQTLEVDATYKPGQSQVNFSTGMIKYSKISVEMPTVGNLTIYPALINAVMPITTLSSVPE